MEYRTLGRTGWKISEISFGSWAIGGTWGEVDDSESLAALRRAVELGVNFFDTADVYGDGRSERLLAKLKRECGEEIHIATKAGRRLDHQYAEGYNRANLEEFVDRSLKNLETDCIDLLQLHCPPTEVFYMPEVFGILEDMVQQGKLRYYGVSVEKVEEGLKALEYPNVQTIQVIFNIFPAASGGSAVRASQETPGRHPGARAVIFGHVDRQIQEGFQVLKGRPPRVQPRWSGL